jgi:uncharacterized protein YjbI with pentapeptide repeats
MPAEWDEQTFEHVLQELRTEGTIDATGVNISAERLARILEAAPEDPARPGRRLFKGARFLSANFAGDAVFKDATFKAMAVFSRATFEGITMFDGAIFEDDAHFRNATFKGPGTVEGIGGFQDAVFKARAWFEHATFNCGAPFDGATFAGPADFPHATFKGDARFGGATFKRGAVFFGARFEDATFEGAIDKSHADFSGATFAGRALFSDAHFEGRARFSGATFERDRDFGPVRVDGALALDATVFNEPIRLAASASMLDCSRTQFRRGADIFVRRAVIVLDDADFAEPSMLAPWLDPVRAEESAVREGRDSDEEPPPRLVSMRRTKVANLTIAGVDLRACRFEGAHGLDRLRLERVRFAETPSGWQRSKRWRVPIRWTRRLAIAEEHHWRAERAGAIGWYGPEVRAPSGLESAPRTPEQIAAMYRALRKGREDSKDEPGAADFYYGEMEMRRQGSRAQGAERPVGGDGTAEHEGNARLAGGLVGDAGSRPALMAERLILWLYWLVSGYGLRASRALIALGLTVVVFAFLFDLWGFRPDRGFGRGLLFSLGSTSSLFRAPETEGFALTASGEVLQIVLRLLGPLFFGLALLSLRGRVKR